MSKKKEEQADTQVEKKTRAVIVLRMEQEQKERIQAVAKKEGCSGSRMMNVLLEEALQARGE